MKKYILILAAILLSATSCQEFLKEEFVSGIGYSYYDTEGGVEDLVRSAYVPLRNWGGTAEGIKMTCHGSDIWEYTNVSDGNEFHMYTSALNPANAVFYTIWSNFYLGISRCNIAINRIPKIVGTKTLNTEANRKARVGEVRFLRAYYYYILVQAFNKVPLLLDESIGVMTEIKRAPVPNIWAAIISDLRYAAENLPATQSESARPTQSAAQQLLAKAYLTRGSAVTEQRGQKSTDMDSAAFYAEKVIASKGDLLPNYDDARRRTNEKNKEVLFAVEYTTNLLYNGGGNQAHRFFTIQYMTIGGLTLDMNYGEAHVRLRPTAYMYDLYDLKNDSRFYKQFQTVWFCNNPGTIPKWTAANAPSPDLVGKNKFGVGDTALYFTMNNVTDNAAIDKKPYTWRPRNKFTDRVFPQYIYHLDPNRAGPSSAIGSLDFELLWLSESYLIAAEAYGRKGNYSKAADLINVVRKRAAYKEGEIKPKQYYEADGGSKADLTKSTETAMMISADQINSFDKLRDFMLEERAREFAGDYERFFDLTRTETFYDRIVKYNKTGFAAVKQWHKLRPIPQNHIDRLQNKGSNEEEQNPGYY